MANRPRAAGSHPDEVADMHSLAELAGLDIPPHVMSILVDMLRSGLPPATIHQLLRHIAKHAEAQEQNSRGPPRFNGRSAPGVPSSSKSKR